MFELWLKRIFFSKIDISIIAYFRIVFGLCMLINSIQLFTEDYIEYYWLRPRFHFHYLGLEWIHALPGKGMYILCFIISLSSLFIMLGFFYRLSIIVFFFSWTYTWLIGQSTYNNHYYLISLLSFLMIFIAANGKYALDDMIFPNIQTDELASWTLFILRFQIAIPYIYGGIAKLNEDWFHGEPVRTWLTNTGGFVDQEWFVYFVSYGGLIFDLTIIPLLIWQRTRLLAFIAVIGFHLSNHFAFSDISIGIFPWLMIAATALFFEPSQFSKLFMRIKHVK